MRRVLIAASIALTVAGGVMACGGGNTATPTAPAATTSVVITPTLVSVTIGGTAPTIGAASQFTATANYSDNTTTVAASLASWQSSSALVATVGVNGLVTGQGAGNTNVSASYLGVTGVKLVSIVALATTIPTPAPIPAPTPSPTPTPTPPTLTCNNATVPSIVACPNGGGNDAPTAKCGDGTYSCSQTRSGTCSSHGGVSCYVCPGGLC